MKNALEQILGILFGAMFIVLSILVTIDTVLRKFFDISLQGTDELGGYSLAVGSTIAFSLALFNRNHIRVDVAHERLGRIPQALLNCISYISLAAFAIFMVVMSVFLLEDTIEYNSTALTPWATPLIWPQSIWFIGLTLFALISTAYALKATLLLVQGKLSELNEQYQPKSPKEELREELDDLTQRQLAGDDQ